VLGQFAAGLPVTLLPYCVLLTLSLSAHTSLLKTLFPLLSSSTSPELRTYILKTILTELKAANVNAKNHKLNRMVQGWLYAMVERGIDAHAEREGTGVRGSSAKQNQAAAGGREAMWAVKLARELWRKAIWNDAKTVNLVAAACFHPNTKVQSAALHFFLANPDDPSAMDSDDEGGSQDEVDPRQVKHAKEVTKKRKGTERRTERILKSVAKKRKRKAAQDAAVSANFSAIQLLHDPQGFAEKLYDSLVKYDRQYTLDHRLLIMQTFGRVTGTHKLCVLGFYSYIVKYLAHHQLRVTSILVSLAQSIHELTPPDVLTPVVRKLANEFVHPGVAAEVNAAGINSIREICRRQPWCMERDLLEDLTEYKKSRDKGVMVAARSLLQLYREVNPGLLKRRERVRTLPPPLSFPFPLRIHTADILPRYVKRVKRQQWRRRTLSRYSTATHGTEPMA
jgi:protein SDA1